LRKIHICAFAKLIFWQLLDILKKLIPRIHFSFSGFRSFFCVLTMSEEPQNTTLPQKVSEPFEEKIWVSKSVGLV